MNGKQDAGHNTFTFKELKHKEEGETMMTWSKSLLAIALSTLAFGAGVMSGYPQAKVLPGEDPAPVTSGGAGVIEGKVV